MTGSKPRYSNSCHIVSKKMSTRVTVIVDVILCTHKLEVYKKDSIGRYIFYFLTCVGLLIGPLSKFIVFMLFHQHRTNIKQNNKSTLRGESLLVTNLHII